jgi:hypothetical protein
MLHMQQRSYGSALQWPHQAKAMTCPALPCHCSSPWPRAAMTATMSAAAVSGVDQRCGAVLLICQFHAGNLVRCGATPELRQPCDMKERKIY